MEAITKDGFYFLLKKDGISVNELFKDDDKDNKTPYYLRPRLWDSISSLNKDKVLQYFTWLMKYHKNEITTQLAIQLLSILPDSKEFIFLKSIYKNINMDTIYYFVATHPNCKLDLLKKIDKLIKENNLKPRDCDRWIDVNHGRIITDIGKMIGYRANKLFDYLKFYHPDPSLDNYWCIPVALKYRNYKLVYSYLTHMDIDTNANRRLIEGLIRKDRGIYTVDSNIKMDRVYYEYVAKTYGV